MNNKESDTKPTKFKRASKAVIKSLRSDHKSKVYDPILRQKFKRVLKKVNYRKTLSEVKQRLQKDDASVTTTDDVESLRNRTNLQKNYASVKKDDAKSVNNQPVCENAQRTPFINAPYSTCDPDDPVIIRPVYLKRELTNVESEERVTSLSQKEHASSGISSRVNSNDSYVSSNVGFGPYKRLVPGSVYVTKNTFGEDEGNDIIVNLVEGLQKLQNNQKDHQPVTALTSHEDASIKNHLLEFLPYHECPNKAKEKNAVELEDDFNSQTTNISKDYLEDRGTDPFPVIVTCDQKRPNGNTLNDDQSVKDTATSPIDFLSPRPSELTHVKYVCAEDDISTDSHSINLLDPKDLQYNYIIKTKETGTSPSKLTVACYSRGEHTGEIATSPHSFVSNERLHGKISSGLVSDAADSKTKYSVNNTKLREFEENLRKLISDQVRDELRHVNEETCARSFKSSGSKENRNKSEKRPANVGAATQEHFTCPFSSKIQQKNIDDTKIGKEVATQNQSISYSKSDQIGLDKKQNENKKIITKEQGLSPYRSPLGSSIDTKFGNTKDNGFAKTEVKITSQLHSTNEQKGRYKQSQKEKTTSVKNATACKVSGLTFRTPKIKNKDRSDTSTISTTKSASGARCMKVVFDPKALNYDGTSDRDCISSEQNNTTFQNAIRKCPFNDKHQHPILPRTTNWQKEPKHTVNCPGDYAYQSPFQFKSNGPLAKRSHRSQSPKLKSTVVAQSRHRRQTAQHRIQQSTHTTKPVSGQTRHGHQEQTKRSAQKADICCNDSVSDVGDWLRCVKEQVREENQAVAACRLRSAVRPPPPRPRRLSASRERLLDDITRLAADPGCESSSQSPQKVHPRDDFFVSKSRQKTATSNNSSSCTASATVPLDKQHKLEKRNLIPQTKRNKKHEAIFHQDRTSEQPNIFEKPDAGQKHTENQSESLLEPYLNYLEQAKLKNTYPGKHTNDSSIFSQQVNQPCSYADEGVTSAHDSWWRLPRLPASLARIWVFVMAVVGAYTLFKIGLKAYKAVSVPCEGLRPDVIRRLQEDFLNDTESSNGWYGFF